MKTHKNLFPAIQDFGVLHASYCRARRGKRDRKPVQIFEQSLERNLFKLQRDLAWGNYETGKYHMFPVYEPKRRTVASLPFRDRVLQHSLISTIEPIWEGRFIDQSYACRPGRGMHRAADTVQGMLRKVQREHGQVYALKADIGKYFASIDHAILQRLLNKHIACEPTLELCFEIMGSTVGIHDSLRCGIPIGNLTSQLWANVYLHELDKFVKHVLKACHFARYMDDFIIIHHDKEYLAWALDEIQAFLWAQLRLQTNAKTQIFPVSLKHGRGLDFVGYHIWPTHRRLRKSSIRRMHHSMKRFQRMYAQGEITLEQINRTVASWVAHAEHADTYGLRQKLLGKYKFSECTKSGAENEQLHTV